MKNTLLIVLALLLFTLLNAQEYTWERYQTSHTGGHQDNGTYSTFTAPGVYQTGEINNPENAGYTGFLLPRLDVRIPVIDTIQDIPNDQGKWVQITWSKAGYDEFYQENFYSIWRSDDISVGKTQVLNGSSNITEVLEALDKESDNTYYWFSDEGIWTYINQVPALTYDTYSYDAPTLFDSLGPDKLNYSSFQVVFHNSTDFYESPADSGYSVDNLAPLSPVLDGEFQLNHVLLSWDENIAEDLQYYAVYRSSEGNPSLEQAYATTTEIEFYDPDPVVGVQYYTVTAMDHNGNESESSNVVEVETSFAVELSVFLEGPFLENEMSTQLNALDLIPLEQPYHVAPWNYPGGESVESIPNADIVDWVLIELRDAENASEAGQSSVISQQAAFLLNTGDIVGLDGITLPVFSTKSDQNLFIALWHRNHLAILSAEAVTLSEGRIYYDFSTEATKVLGEASGYTQLAPDTWGMVAGDANADGVINSGDKITAWSLEAGSTSYNNSDLNMDGQINNPDKNETWLINLGKGCEVPE